MLLNWKFENSYLNLPKQFYSFGKADKYNNPEIVIFNYELSKELNLNSNKINTNDLAKTLSGQLENTNNNFFSQAYAGHQFGYFTILGDGRALLLGEHINKKNKRYDIQLKGSGKTPYSRNGDGKAALGPMLREYIISESMHHLNIPTTRSLAVIKTGENILRDKYIPGAILTRVASSHIRVGTFQFAKIKNSDANIKELVNYTIDRHFQELKNKKNKGEILLKHIVNLQIKLIVNWMRVGFIHGVMNTDNMSIIGETIDYGPCAFMEEYNPKTVFSSIDQLGRYSYINQPKIAQWNLARFAETILFLIDKDKDISIKKAEIIIGNFEKEYKKQWLSMMKAKIGLFDENEKDINLINDLLNIMHVFKLDFTNTFYDLMHNNLKKYNFLNDWLKKYDDRKKLEKNNKDFLFKLAKKNNPLLIPRNHIMDKYLKNAENENKYENLFKWINLLKKPYDEKTIPEFYKKPANEKEKIKETFCGT